MGDLLGQRGAIDQLQDQRTHPVRFFQAVNGADVWMIQGSQYFRFPLKASHSLAILDKLLREDLQGHISAQAGIGGPIDRTHTALTELLSSGRWFGLVTEDLRLKWIYLADTRSPDREAR